ncbi:hypothetical protein Ddye_012799 [Dipteronia dyeriana]|uniref:Uncharacterized protein n=1 Tax=Dipteronia dyeriana TaxID=168575 RepID=A0AAD9X5E6_9ROSI|nr:hypothetical protein Ddye_012799 [Dipteronia dyeriana]
MPADSPKKPLQIIKRNFRRPNREVSISNIDDLIIMMEESHQFQFPSYGSLNQEPQKSDPKKILSLLSHLHFHIFTHQKHRPQHLNTTPSLIFWTLFFLDMQPIRKQLRRPSHHNIFHHHRFFLLPPPLQDLHRALFCFGRYHHHHHPTLCHHLRQVRRNFEDGAVMYHALDHRSICFSLIFKGLNRRRPNSLLTSAIRWGSADVSNPFG